MTRGVSHTSPESGMTCQAVKCRYAKRLDHLASSPLLSSWESELRCYDGLITDAEWPELQFWWAVEDSNLRPPACKAGALTS